jgi:hypothetical protein
VLALRALREKLGLVTLSLLPSAPMAEMLWGLLFIGGAVCLRCRCAYLHADAPHKHNRRALDHFLRRSADRVSPLTPRGYLSAIGGGSLGIAAPSV